MVDVEKEAVSTPRHHASTAVTAHDFAPGARRDRLTHAHRFTHVGGDAPQLLGVALGHFDDVCSHFDLLPPPLLPTTTACFADGERDLVASPSLVRGAAEDL